MRNPKPIIPAALCALVAVLGVLAPAALARMDSEIVPAEKRHVSVEKASILAKQVKLAPLPEPLSQPFAPPNFDLSDAEEAAAAAAAARLANAGNPALPAPPSDHELLEEIGAKVRPNGTMYLNGKPLLMFGKRFVKTGAHFTVTYKGSDYDLELTEIDATNFTLRYKNDEITRPIQTASPAKSP
jgi:hypothetical protein